MAALFQIGDHMVYGTNGVCVVSEIRNSPFDAADQRLFYVLTPVNDISNLVIYTPVDNDKVLMRGLISADEARAIIERIPTLEVLEVPVEKQRREIYRNTMQSGDLEQFVRLIKTVSRRRANFRRTRRRIPDLDSDFEHTAKNCLYGELAEVLGLTREEIHNIVSGQLGC